MFKILVIGALPIELNSIKKMISFHKIKDFEIKYFLLGTGNYNTIFNLKNYIDQNGKPDFVLNIGVCGYNGDNIVDYFQVYRIKNQADFKEILCPIYINFAKLESISSSERIVTDGEKILPEIYVDMESYGVDFVLSKEKIPYLILKIPLDKISNKSLNLSLKEIENKFTLISYFDLFDKIKIFLENNQKSLIILDKYFNNFYFTFTEKEIFKKNYNKIISYNIDFDKFFEENKFLKKEDFLAKMNKI